MAMSLDEFNNLNGTPAGGFKDKGITSAILDAIPSDSAASLDEVMKAVKKKSKEATPKSVKNTIYSLRKKGKVDVKYDSDHNPFYVRVAQAEAEAEPAQEDDGGEAVADDVDGE